MKKAQSKGRTMPDDEMRPEYDFSRGVRGKYAKRLPKDRVMVVLEPEVASLFPTSKSLNEALRTLKHFADIVKRAKKSA